MNRINTVHLNLLGEYRDAWLYKRHLYLWDREGKLSFVDLEVLAKFVARNHGAAIGNVVQTLVFRNDWKVGENFRSMIRVPEIEEAFLLPFRDRSRVDIELPSRLLTESESEPYGGVVLDTGIYANRVYLATQEGLLESYIRANNPAIGYELNQQTDFRVAHVAVRYAAINASAEDKGLYFARVAFSNGDEPGFRKGDWQKVADNSFAASYANHNLLNYAGGAVPRFLAARIEESRPHGAARYEEKQVVGYGTEADISSLMYSALQSGESVSTNSPRHEREPSIGNLEVLGNTNSRLLVVWNDALRVVAYRSRDREFEVKPHQGYRPNAIDAIRSVDILQTYPMGSGFVVELFDSLRLMTADGSFELAHGQVARVRTFASSLRYKEAVVAIQEDHVSLIGFYLASSVLL